MAYQLFTLPKQVNISSNLTLLSGAKALFELSGTSTPTNTYQDSALTTPHTNPVVADSAGVFAKIYLNPEVRYRLTLSTSDDVTLPGYPLDDINDQVLSQSIIGELLNPITAAEIAAGVTPTNYAYLPGAIQRYGTNTTPGTTDMATAIQNALKCNPRVFDANTERSVFAIGTKLYLTSDAQIFQGNGRGNVNEPGRTVLKWIGASGGKMISVSDGDEHFQNCSILDIELDGNALANVGIEGYDDAVAGGCWRNKYRVSIRGVTQGVNSTGIYLGNGTFPDFAHDTEIWSSYISDPDRGVWGKGSKTHIFATTIRGCTEAGIYAPAGSAFTIHGGVFSQNVRDLDGVDWAQVDFHGSWHEDSTTGIMRASTSHNTNFYGCYLHTAYATLMMDLGNAAGDFSAPGSRLSPTTSSGLVTNINGDYELNIFGSGLTASNGYRIYSPTGAIRSSNGMFFAGVTSDEANATGDGTVYSLNALAFTEYYDLNSQFAAASGIFTGGLTGYMNFKAQLSLGGITASHTSALLELVTTISAYPLWQGNLANLRDASDIAIIAGSADRVPVTATNTAYLRLTVTGGTKVVDILSGGVATNWRTQFSGRYV